jgi:hypothetical protein
MENTTVLPEGMITAESFAQSKGMLESKVIEMIKSGFYIGKVIEGTWYIYEVEKSKNHPHHAQDDLNTAQKALSVGGTLSGISTFLHIAAAIGFTVLNLQEKDIGLLMLTVGVYVGILASWSIIHALLSIVVTNALAAKYMIYQSSMQKR